MSSILKALKKLENETTDKEAPQFVWPQPVDTKSSLNLRLKPRFSLTFFSYKTALIFFFSTTVILLFFISSPSKIQTGHETTVPVAAVKPIEKKALPPKKIIVEKTDEGVTAFVAVEPEQTVTTGAKTPETLRAHVKENETDSNDREIARDIKTEEPVKFAEESTGAPTTNTPAGWLTLQGISWSQEPLKRIAVINSTIVREGKVVDGGRVARIDKEYVVIEKDGEELMLTFD